MTITTEEFTAKYIHFAKWSTVGRYLIAWFNDLREGLLAFSHEYEYWKLSIAMATVGDCFEKYQLKIAMARKNKQFFGLNQLKKVYFHEVLVASLSRSKRFSSLGLSQFFE